MRAAKHRIFSVLCAFVTTLCWLAPNLSAGPEGDRYASIAVDIDSDDILHARQIDALRFPASLTKMMTLYLTFDAINSGELSLGDKIKVSSYAAGAPPTKLGLKAGQTISVNEAIQALAVKSSNDVAVVLAERLGGSQSGFARQMTAKAQVLGMTQTVYYNASGLPHPEQVTTARDQAKLAKALLQNHRKYYHYFGQQNFVWKGQSLKNHNTLLGRVDGVDGFKTGFTRASGYNLTISAQRGGRRIVAVVLGGATGTARDQHMERLIDRSFDVLEDKQFQVADYSANPSLIKASNVTPTAPLQAFQIRGRGGKDVSIITGAGADASLCRVIGGDGSDCIVIAP